MMQTWFESKVKYMKVSESGTEMMVTESFLLDAVSYTDAETRIIRKMQEMVRGGEFTIVDIKKSRIAEVFPFEDGEWWYKATINLVTVDEEAGKEKKLRTYYLIMADDIREALNRLDESLNYLVIPYVTSSLAVSNIVDVFPYEPSESMIPEGFVPLEKKPKPNPIFTDGVNPFENDTEEEETVEDAFAGDDFREGDEAPDTDEPELEEPETEEEN
ncbi:DUF4494 domain-containing protein [Maribellus sp. YY47]|uniref:DUF4494 domain-containing protein n=1 Tax=Maribellus sp. YY47 TaxID=2929486 RepID=UPI0020009AA8|nr:DUF4494 domain-containing protein [Maribellus sp. YY47]MCK3682626.1 DUF4494 domain-containing protein [Maribellus sp. YY47]